MKDQIVAALKHQNVERARQAYFEDLRQASDVAVMLQPPRVQVAGDPSRELGASDAPVTIVEFADFECPFCQKATPMLQELLTKYKGQVRLTFRDFPLEEIHPGAQRAAEAARCATDQGKFWQFHDMLFAHPGKVAEEDLRQYAVSVGLDAKQFNSCLRDGKFKAQVEQDFKAAVDAGVSGTPAFFINGVFFNGLPQLSTLEATIDDELASAKMSATKAEMTDRR
jgi:protein-disulfide isomerase